MTTSSLTPPPRSATRVLRALVASGHAALIYAVLVPVRIYRRVFSAWKPTPTCRFVPTCSQYAVEAIETRGIVVGSALALGRIARCHPLCKGGHDPVPPRRAVATAPALTSLSGSAAHAALVEPAGPGSAR